MGHPVVKFPSFLFGPSNLDWSGIIKFTSKFNFDEIKSIFSHV